MAKEKNIGQNTNHDGNEIRNFVLWLMTTIQSAAKLLKVGQLGFDTQKEVVLVKTTSEIRELVYREKQKEVGANYTILPADDRSLIFLTAGVTITIDNTLPDGFYCEICSLVGPSEFHSGTATVNYPNGYILGSNKVATLLKRNSNSNYYLFGELESV